MASETTAASQKTTQRRKKAAVLALAGVVGIGAAATMANWTDEAAAGADFQAGQLDLEIATTAVGETPGKQDWKTGTEVEVADLGLKSAAWGPGDSDEAQIHVRLKEGTTHEATLTSTREVNADYWIINDTVKNVKLAPGQAETFTVTVQMDPEASNNAQGTKGQVVWDFVAQQQPNDGGNN